LSSIQTICFGRWDCLIRHGCIESHVLLAQEDLPLLHAMSLSTAERSLLDLGWSGGIPVRKLSSGVDPSGAAFVIAVLQTQMQRNGHTERRTLSFSSTSQKYALKV